MSRIPGIQIATYVDSRIDAAVERATRLFGTKRNVIEAALYHFVQLDAQAQLAIVEAANAFLGEQPAAQES